MNKFACAAFAAAALGSATAHAQDYYAGIATATPGEAHLKLDNGARFDNYNRPRPLKAYGGYNFTPNYALEAGYANFGAYKFRIGSHEPRFETSVMYAAGKASMALGESFSVFGKLGVARNRVVSENFDELSGTEIAVRPLLGFGADYRLTRNVALTLEWEQLGTNKYAIGALRQNRLEAGVKVSF